MSATLITSCLYWLHPPPPVVPHPPVFAFSAHIEPVRNREDKVYGLALNVNDFQIIWGNRKHSTVTNCSRSSDKINLCIVMHVYSILFWSLCWYSFNNLAQLFKHFKSRNKWFALTRVKTEQYMIKAITFQLMFLFTTLSTHPFTCLDVIKVYSNPHFLWAWR